MRRTRRLQVEGTRSTRSHLFGAGRLCRLSPYVPPPSPCAVQRLQSQTIETWVSLLSMPSLILCLSLALRQIRSSPMRARCPVFPQTPPNANRTALRLSRSVKPQPQIAAFVFIPQPPPPHSPQLPPPSHPPPHHSFHPHPPSPHHSPPYPPARPAPPPPRSPASPSTSPRQP